jgi:hypothetical protein
VTIDVKKYTFSFTNLDAKRTGKYSDIQTVYMAGQMEPIVETSNPDADSAAALDWSVQDVSRDTSYTSVTTEEGGSSIKSVTQKCTWDDTSEFWLEYSARFNAHATHAAAGVTEQTTMTKNVNIILVMFYNKNGPSSAIGPKNTTPPGTHGSGNSFAVTRSNAPFTVYDIYGRKLSQTSPAGVGKILSMGPGVYIRREAGGTGVRRMVIVR